MEIELLKITFIQGILIIINGLIVIMNFRYLGEIKNDNARNNGTNKERN